MFKGLLSSRSFCSRRVSILKTSLELWFLGLRLPFEIFVTVDTKGFSSGTLYWSNLRKWDICSKQIGRNPTWWQEGLLYHRQGQGAHKEDRQRENCNLTPELLCLFRYIHKHSCCYSIPFMVTHFPHTIQPLNCVFMGVVSIKVSWARVLNRGK